MSAIKQFVSHDPATQEWNKQLFNQMRMVEKFDPVPVKEKPANDKFVKLSQVGPNDFVIEIVRKTGKRYYRNNRFVPVIFNMTRLLAFSGGMRVMR